MLKLYPALLSFDRFFAIEAVSGFYKLPPEKELRYLLTSAGMTPSRASEFTRRHDFLHALVGARSKPSTKPPTIGFSDFLKHRLHLEPSDAVVVKMDVEGHEYDIVETLLQDGTAGLIDELFLEVHYNHPRMRKLFHWCTERQRKIDKSERNPFWCDRTLQHATSSV